MAINYTNLFTDVGVMLKSVNIYLGYASTALPANLSEIATDLTTNGMFDILSGIPEQYNSFRDNASQWSSTLSTKIENRFTHFATVTSQLPVPSQFSVSDVLAELIRDMIAESETVDANVVTIDAVAANGANIGDVSILTTKVLDGYSSPRDGVVPHPSYYGVNSELAVTTETLTLTCTADSKSGQTEGREQFSVTGAPKGSTPFDWRSEGSGQGNALSVGNGRGIIQNGEFELWTSTNSPNSWTIAAGAAGTEIFRESSGPKRGTYSLKFTGTAEAEIRIHQPISVSSLNPLRSYCVAVWVKGHASVASGTLTIQFYGTGYTPGALEKIVMNAGALAAQTSFGLEHFFVNIPSNVPSDFGIEIKTTGTLSAGVSILIDGLMLTETLWHGGIGLAAVAGEIPAIKGDRYTIALSNNNVGTFQTFMRKRFNVQLPSNAAGAETINDALAE